MICRGTSQWPHLWPTCWGWWPLNWPQPGVAHAAIVGLHPLDQPPAVAVWESTCGSPLRCLLAKKLVNGVQCHGIKEWLASQRGAVWWHPLTPEARAMYDIERAQARLWELSRRPYDLVGAAAAADILPAPWRKRIRQRFGDDCLAALYCSELDSAVLEEGFWEAPGYWWANENQWSPVAVREAALARRTVEAGRRLR
jgi:hypothetical protein